MQSRWAALALIFLVGLNMPMQFQAVPALAPFLVAEAGLGYGEIGALTGLFMAPGIVLAGPAALVAGALGDRLTVALGVALMAAATVVFVASDSYAVMYASRLAGGVGGVAVAVFLPKMVTDWFAGREIATAQSLVASSFGVGVGLALAILPALATWTDWRLAMLANTGIGAVAVVLLLTLYREHPHGAAAPRRAERGRGMSGREGLLAGLAGSGRGLFGTGYVVFMGFAPPLLILQGMSVAQAGLLTSLAAMMSIVSVPLGGWLSDRSGRVDWFIALGAIGTGLACLALPYLAPAALWVLAFGLLRGGCTGGIMAMPAQALRPESRRAGFAVASSVYFAIMAAGPAVAGFLLAETGDARTPVFFAAGLWFAILAQLALFRILVRRWVVSPVVR